MPRSGVVTFDYVSTNRTPSGISAMSEEEYHNLITAIDEAISEFNYNRNHEATDNFFSYPGEIKGEFDGGVDEERLSTNSEVVEEEEKIILPCNPTLSNASGFSIGSTMSGRSEGQLQLSTLLQETAELHYDYMDISDHLHLSALYRHHVKSDHPPARKRFEHAYSALMIIEILACGEYFTAEQVAGLVRRLPREQYLQVELLTSLLPRIVDLKNVNVIVDIFNDRLWHEARYRIGILNIGSCFKALTQNLLRFEVPRCKDDQVVLNAVRRYDFEVEEKFKHVWQVKVPMEGIERARHEKNLMQILESDVGLRRHFLSSSAPYRTLRAVRKKDYKFRDAILRINLHKGSDEKSNKMINYESKVAANLKELLLRRQNADTLEKNQDYDQTETTRPKQVAPAELMPTKPAKKATQKKAIQRRKTGIGNMRFNTRRFAFVDAKTRI